MLSLLLKYNKKGELKMVYDYNNTRPTKEEIEANKKVCLNINQFDLISYDIQGKKMFALAMAQQGSSRNKTDPEKKWWYIVRLHRDNRRKICDDKALTNNQQKRRDIYPAISQDKEISYTASDLSKVKNLQVHKIISPEECKDTMPRGIFTMQDNEGDRCHDCGAPLFYDMTIGAEDELENTSLAADGIWYHEGSYRRLEEKGKPEEISHM
jgi:hypothetical protein